jgi:hypothetical protein
MQMTKKMWALGFVPVAFFQQCAPECTPPPPPPEALTAPVPDDGLRQVHSDAVWNKIANCESGGNWSHPPVTNSSGTYSGGLMIGHRWWGPNGGKQFAEYPYQATRAEQIHVAENIADANGLDAGWQCWP